MAASSNAQTSFAPAMPVRENDIADAGLSMVELRARIIDAQDFHARFLENAKCDAQGLHITRMPDWSEKFIRRNATIPLAALAKLGSNTIAKRRPDDAQAFHDHIAQCYAARSTLLLRVVVGPVKNVQRFGAYQSADMAEYLTLIQLARVAETMAAIYPHGIRVQLVPDDIRGSIANNWPVAYSKLYISSLQRMVKQLQFESWMDVEDGEARLYEQYRVTEHTHRATMDVMADACFEEKFARACMHARENLFTADAESMTQQAIEDSAMRYLVAHRAEIASGMWSPINALPLMYANHAGNFQLYTMGRGLTKLPWQIRLPFAVLAAEENGAAPQPPLPYVG